MRNDPIVEEVHRIRQQMLEEFGGDVDALIEDCNRRALNGEFGEFKIVTRAPRFARADRDRDAE
jgi:hypothetical protein